MSCTNAMEIYLTCQGMNVKADEKIFIICKLAIPLFIKLAMKKNATKA